MTKGSYHRGAYREPVNNNVDSSNVSYVNQHLVHEKPIHEFHLGTNSHNNKNPPHPVYDADHKKKFEPTIEPAKSKENLVNDEKFPQQDLDIALAFSKDIYKEFDKFLKAIVLFGSSSKDKDKNFDPEKHDIDILLIVDDVAYNISADMTETYRVLIEKYIVKHSKRLHITTLKFTSFWELIREGDPIGLNMLRDGVALIDTGFFTPMQMLLYQGKVRPSKEAMMVYYSKSRQTLINSRWHLLQAAMDLYWVVIDSAHAAIIAVGEMPPSPKEVAKVLEEKLVKKGYISKKCPYIMDEMYSLSKQILRKEVKDITGNNFEAYYKQAEFFVDEVKHFIEKKQ